MLFLPILLFIQINIIKGSPVLQDHQNTIIDLFSGEASNAESSYVRRRREHNFPKTLKETSWDASLTPEDGTTREKRRILRGGLSKRRHTHTRSAFKRETSVQEPSASNFHERQARKCYSRSLSSEPSMKQSDESIVAVNGNVEKNNKARLAPINSLSENYYEYEDGPAESNKDSFAYSNENEFLEDSDSRKKRGGKQNEEVDQIKRNNKAEVKENSKFSPVKRENFKEKKSPLSSETSKVKKENKSNENKREAQESPAQEEGKFDYYDDKEYNADDYNDTKFGSQKP